MDGHTSWPWIVWRERWVSTAALLLAIPGLAWLDYRFEQLPNHLGPPLYLLPVMLGCFLLTPWQQLGLVLALLAAWSWTVTKQQSPLEIKDFISILSPIPLLAALVWLTHLRQSCSLQRTALAEQQRELSEQLECSLEAAAIAHEVGQPLSQLLLQLKLMQLRLEQQPQLPTIIGDLLNDVQHSGQQILELITAMKRLQKNEAAPEFTVNLSAIVKGCLEQAESSFKDSMITISHTGLHQKHQVMGDAKQLEIAIANLLRNAQQSLKKQPLGDRHLQVSLITEQHQCALCMADSGEGLPHNDLQRLAMKSNTPGGMGLGLLMVAGIARGHHGELRLGASAALGGAELCLLIPGVN